MRPSMTSEGKWMPAYSLQYMTWLTVPAALHTGMPAACVNAHADRRQHNTIGFLSRANPGVTKLTHPQLQRETYGTVSTGCGPHAS